MCGRFTVTSSEEQLRELFGFHGSAGVSLPRYNIAPTQDILVLLAADDGLQARAMRWGLVPHWAKDLKISSRLINARSETAHEKPAFRDAFRKRRCLVIASGFYEWSGPKNARKVHYLHPTNHKPWAFAGLWERWTAGTEVVHSATIMTTTPNEIVAAFHDRMPVIVGEDDFDSWLSLDNQVEELRPLFLPAPPNAVTAHEVCRDVGNVRVDEPYLVESVA